MSNTVPTVILFYRSGDQNNMDWRNRPQTNALIAGSIVLISGGMNMAQGLGWNLFTGDAPTEQFMFSWFVAAIVGALLVAPLLEYVQKRIIMGISTILVLAGGIIFTSAPQNVDALLAARYINGFAVGLATVPFLIHASEIAAKPMRGYCLSLEQYSVSIGIAIQVIYSSQWSYGMGFPANRLHGIIDIVFGVCALASVTLIIESPIFHLRKDREHEALECLRCLERPAIVSDATKLLLEEHKAYVQENENHSLGEDIRDSVGPLLKMLVYRSMVALSFTVPLTTAIEISSFIVMGYPYGWPPIVFGVLRFLGAFIALWLVDTLGRKIYPNISLLIMAGLTIGLGVIFSKQSSLFYQEQMSASCAISLVLQFFAGAFVPSSSVYLSEAFPLSLKAYCMTACVVLEQAIQIIVICTYQNTVYRNIYYYCLPVGVIMFVACVLFVVFMPETKHTTLRESANRFKRWLHLGCR